MLVLCILSAQAGVEETSGVAEPGCDCQLAYLAEAANPVHMTVHMHRSILEQDRIDDIAGLDPFTAGDDDDNLKIRCACNLTNTADWNPLAFESTEALEEELYRRKYKQRQENAQATYNFVMSLVEWIHFLVVIVLPQLLKLLINLAATHEVTCKVMRVRKQAREMSDAMIL